MIDRYNVWARPLTLRHMMSRLFQDAFVTPRAERPARQGGAMDVYEEGDHLVVTLQLPGVKPEDIDVTLANGVLTVRGQTTSEDERKDRGYVVREQRTGSYMRQIPVPPDLDADAVQATFEHGVLRLTLPKPAQPGARRIPITTGASPAIAPAPAAEPAPASEPATATADATASAAPDSAAQPAASSNGTSGSRKRTRTAESAPKAGGRKSAASRKPRARKAEPTPA